MIVRMKVSMCGHFVTHDVGDEVEFDNTAAQRLIDADFAEAVTPGAKAKIERADRPARIEKRDAE